MSESRVGQLVLDVESAIPSRIKHENPERKNSFTQNVLTPVQLLRMRPGREIARETCFLANTSGAIQIEVPGNWKRVWDNKNEHYLYGEVVSTDSKEDEHLIGQIVYVSKGEAVRKPKDYTGPRPRRKRNNSDDDIPF